MYLLSTLIEDQLCLLMFPINDNNDMSTKTHKKIHCKTCKYM